MSIRFFDMFAGIGGFRSGLEAVGGFECIGHCEIDKYANQAYNAIYEPKGELYFEDARKINPKDLPNIDLIRAGFPCQSFSIAGLRKGFKDDARGTLFFEIARIAAVKRPSFLLLENVPGLLSHDKGRTFATILSTLDELGYDVTWQVLNSKNFGVPQSRKRVYIIGYLRSRCIGEILSFTEVNRTPVIQVIPGTQGERVYSDCGVGITLTSGAGGFGGKCGLYEVGIPVKVKTKTGYQIAHPGDSIDLAYPSLNSRRGRVGDNIAHTVTPGNPQGDASLSGAKYGIYKGDQLIDTYTTDKNGQFTTKYYVCDSDWTLRELTPSEGYLVNTEILHIGAEAKLYTAEYNSTALDALETVQKGKIAVIKHCDDGSTQIETPEKGAEFEVYLKKSGSYENAKESERDILVCDENGFAETKLLPYGIYTVMQTKGWDGKEMMKPFDVFISKNGETYRYLINNAVFKSLIEIVKKDAETGKIIPASGIGFKVRNTDTGEYIVQHINYPTPIDIDTYYTDSTGKLMLPEALSYGNYEIVEQNTCYGYVLDSTPVPFKVDGSKTVVTVEKHNIAQKGTITVAKTGEVFSTVSQTDRLCQPVYETKGLQGAVYEITAAEDVYTLDGTLRYAKGAVVDEITTEKDGRATSKPLYLGKYEIREIKAPYGMVLNGESQTIELTYAGQEISITETSAEFCNERQKAEISLAKVLAQDEKFGIGMNSEILSVQFGLFADEDLKAADGSVIPKDSLLEIVSCDENGKAAFNTDIPVGAKLYVKEISADIHYLLSDEKYPVIFEYAGQNVATVNLSVNNGELIENDLIYGTVKGLKIDRETDETIAGALFGLFKADETEFTEKTAILLAKSNENGIFTFENIPFGEWTIKELQPAENYLPSDNIHRITVTENEQIIEITAVNDRIPEIKTTATVDGEKEICATEVFTLTDTVSYKHLIPGKEYVLKGILIDKSTGKPLVINGKKIHSEASFTPENPSGEVTVKFTFDSKFIKQDISRKYIMRYANYFNI